MFRTPEGHGELDELRDIGGGDANRGVLADAHRAQRQTNGPETIVFDIDFSLALDCLHGTSGEGRAQIVPTRGGDEISQVTSQNEAAGIEVHELCKAGIGVKNPAVRRNIGHAFVEFLEQRTEKLFAASIRFGAVTIVIFSTPCGHLANRVLALPPAGEASVSRGGGQCIIRPVSLPGTPKS